MQLYVYSDSWRDISENDSGQEILRRRKSRHSIEDWVNQAA